MLLGVDVGGTFTDAVLVSGRGAVHSAKAPSTPAEQSRGVLAAIEAVLARAGAAPADVTRFAHGMTVATNALLEGRGARAALIATEGFTDIVELGRQARASLYRLCEAGPTPLVTPELRFAAPERTGPDGPLRELREGDAVALIERLARARPEAVAVALLHSYAHPRHEVVLGELIARRLPGVHVSLSHDLVGTFREYERAATTEVDAALSPLLSEYLRRLRAQARRRRLPAPRIMQSSGGLIDAERASAHAALTVLSGPAGGVGGALALARATGERDVLCFDMGGTSCDVCVIEDGRVAETAQRSVAGRPLALPALDIHTVGAGGGSIAWRDPGGALRVGPRSAGAVPGPACYGRGGREPTVTDANLLLGRLLDDAPLAGELTLDRAAAEHAIAGLARTLDLDTVRCAEGIVRVAEAEMLRALRVMTVERGLDPRRFALMSFGGAGPLHAAAIARELGIARILCPRACGVLCALGLAAAAPRHDVARTVMLAGEELTARRIADERARLIARAQRALAGVVEEEDPLRGSGMGRSVASHQSGADEQRRREDVRVRYELRYRGQSFELTVPESPPDSEAPPHPDRPPNHNAPPETHRSPHPDALREAFARAHEERYGYRDEGAEVELVTMRVSVWGAAPRVRLAPGAGGTPVPGRTRVVFEGRELDAVCLRGELPAGTAVRGPAVCALGEATLFVAPGWHGAVDEHGSVLLERAP
ncbi:MAG TPA: hydantoinase/oxoprolinase family protein [Solirubrobacteraceae bacterium]|jgi:N-methylhydantoinase A